MQYRQLGSSGIRVSVIGFGAWGIGGRTAGATSYGETDDAESSRALNAAFDRGINFYDTANVYGDGHSEELIGNCFKGRRHEVIIATKAGITSSFRGYDFSSSALRTSLEGSLRRLQTDYVDLLQLHNAGPSVIRDQPDIADLMNRFVEEGKVRACGFSTPSPEDALELVDFPNVVCFQVNCNLLDWRAIDVGLFDRALVHNIAIIARTPLAFGFLTGQFTGDIVFDVSDHRSRWSRKKISTWLETADAIFSILAGSERKPDRAEVALRFCLSFDAVATVIPGMLSCTEVLANVAAVDKGPLYPSLMRDIERIYRHHESLLAS